ncbi:MAG: PTS sugar transporter subunit IIA [Kiritimatiellae bacterium]|nr:PTS sugar transporter subunit IIA [Kiritimatiellia bacterium]
MTYQTFNLKEVSEYLRVPESAIEELARRGDMPCERQGGRLTFRRGEIDAWASRRLLGLPEKRLEDFHERWKGEGGENGDGGNGRRIMGGLLGDGEGRVALGLTSRGKAGVIGDMVKLADGTGLVCDAADLLESLTEREKLCSTAMAGGFALLHPRNHEPYMFAESFLAVGRTVGRIYFGAEDGSATDVFFLICCQDDRSHLHVLARLCMMCHHTAVLDEIRAAQSAAEVVERMVAAEAAVVG